MCARQVRVIRLSRGEKIIRGCPSTKLACLLTLHLRRHGRIKLLLLICLEKLLVWRLRIIASNLESFFGTHTPSTGVSHCEYVYQLMHCLDGFEILLNRTRGSKLVNDRFGDGCRGLLVLACCSLLFLLLLLGPLTLILAHTRRGFQLGRLDCVLLELQSRNKLSPFRKGEVEQVKIISAIELSRQTAICDDLRPLGASSSCFIGDLLDVHSQNK